MNYIKVLPLRDPLELVGVDDFLVDDWDSEGAKAVSEETVDRAQEFLCALPYMFQQGRAMAGIDGSLGIHWTVRSSELYVDFRADGRTRYYFSDRQNVSIEDFLPAGHTVEQLLAAVSPALCWFDRTDQVAAGIAFEVSASDEDSWVTSIEVDDLFVDWIDASEVIDVEDPCDEAGDDLLAFNLD
ncbi:hypothetical protein [Burkholderia sp. RF4-BP95]|uniref:hypothetical protein n=1 Tax=Burkholderia sp. RF4-BP95 TaxID=1637845 RepID=UPI0012E3C297|nr:hypothetical protein [Burkholderia sp. RF4-BP95]